MELLQVMAAGMEAGSANDYNKWANECAQNADSVSKKLFEQLVGDEERHFNQYNDEMEILKKFGDNYLALQLIERARTWETEDRQLNKNEAI